MNKLEEIFKSWGIAMSPDEEQNKLAAERLKICADCEHKRVTPINHCSVCGCTLKTKVYSPVVGACPVGKWDTVDKNSYNL